MPCFKIQDSGLSGVISRALQMNLESGGGDGGGGGRFEFIVSKSPIP